MGIYIKGMRMPENCIKCPMQFGGMCYVMPAEVDESRVAPTVEAAWKQGKPDWCPLTEVPKPHGNLIDADEFAEGIMHEAEQYWGLLKPETREMIQSVCKDIRNYPAVIEREDGETDEHTD